MGDAIEPEFDRDGYPTEATLRRISEWPPTDLDGLFAFVGKAWRYPRMWAYREDELGMGLAFLECSTGGWSGNEDLLGALSENVAAWAMAWYSSRRGGHHEFRWRKQNGE